MDCRCTDKRKWIVQHYNVNLVTYARLLNGMKLRSDARAEITDIYYMFECVNKVNGKKESIVCGKGAGEDFLRLTGQKKPILFDPLKSELVNKKSAKKNEVQLGKEGKADKKVNETTLQLHNAIQWLITIWGKVPYGSLLSIKNKLEKYYFLEPFPSQIEIVNNIIGKDYKKRTLTQMINELRKENNIKEYKFDLLEKVLINRENPIKSNF